MKRDEMKKGADSASYYRLHTEAVEDLVGASKENTPRYSREELEKYRSGRGKRRFPEPLKALLIKWWFYGAVCFFVFMGLGLYVGDQLDLYFIAAVIMGMATDLLINRFLRFTEKMEGGSKCWMMVTRRGAAGFFLNLAYAALLLFLVVTAYGLVNAVLGVMGGYLGVEPIAFGLFTVGADMLCIGFKRMFMKMLNDARRK